MLNAGGKPTALKVTGPLGLLAFTCNETLSPSALLWGPGLSSASRVLTDHTKDWLTRLLPSLAVTVT
jgi:hypothetical protein